MKMSDIFTGGKVVEIGGYHDNDAYINTENHGFGTDEDGVAEAVMNAINSHDKLVELLKQMTDTVKWMSECDDMHNAPECTWIQIAEEIKQAESLLKELDK